MLSIFISVFITNLYIFIVSYIYSFYKTLQPAIVYLTVGVVRITVRFVQPELQRQRFRFWKSHAFQLPALVKGRRIVGQRDVAQVTEVRRSGCIFLPRCPDLQLLSYNKSRYSSFHFFSRKLYQQCPPEDLHLPVNLYRKVA